MDREQINNLINTCQQEIKRLQEENKQLKEQLQQKEIIINKVNEYVKENVYEVGNDCGAFWWEITDKDELLEILNNKGG